MSNNYNFQKVKKLIVKEKTKFHQININEIIYIYSEAGISTINKINNDKITCAKNLSYFDAYIN